MSGRTPVADRARGEPLIALAVIGAGWLALRVLLWQPPFGEGPTLALPAAAPVARLSAKGPESAFPPPPPSAPVAIPGPDDAPIVGPVPAPWHIAQTVSPATAPLRARQILGQELLLASAFAHMNLAPAIARLVATGEASAKPADGLDGGRALLAPAGSHPQSAGGRWGGDMWLLVRGGSLRSVAAIQPSYGRSQAGGVLRYRLAPGNRHDPVAYLRTTRSLAGPRETEVAAGLAARPLAGLPLSVAGEVRVSERPGGREVRPAAFAVTELPPAALPLGLRAEAYAQAGYVGGRFATAFVDGQARIDAKLSRVGRDGEARAGGAVWGGAQKDAGRLDVGPSATVSFRLGRTQSRLAVDYRMRIAGNAEPASGPALTISAGF